MPSAAVPIVSTVASTVLSSKANKSAAKSQQQAADQASAVQKEMYDTTREDLRPFRETGYAANNKLSQLMGLGGIDRDAIKAKLVASNPKLFGGTQQQSGGGVGMAATNDGREALGRNYAAQQAANGGSWREGWGNNAALTPEDYAGIGEFAALSPIEQMRQKETGTGAALKLSQILNKYRVS